MKEAGLYLHIPFCQSKCHYCAFNSQPAGRVQAEAYLVALAQKIEALAQEEWVKDSCFSTLFWVEGLPTLASSEGLCQLLHLCQTCFNLKEGAEISLESNPNTVTEAGLARLRRAGFNRLSLGCSLFDDALLASLGRRHSAEQAITAVSLARQAGFTNVNLDLIYGLPNQSLEQWQHSLEIAQGLQPTHLALYELTIEEGTHFASLAAQQRLSLPSEDDVADMEDLIPVVVGDAYRRYEIANYCRPGHECRHNINYWRNGSYLGIGAGAVSCLAGRRVREEGNPDLYSQAVAHGQSTSVAEESLSCEASFRETVIMGLRLLDGVDIQALQQRFALRLEDVYGSLCDELCTQGLLIKEHGFLRLSPAMLPLANQVLCQLV